MKRLITFLKPFWGRMATGISMKFAGTMMDLFLPYILARIIDQAEDISTVLRFGGWMLGIALVGWVLNVWANRKTSAVIRDTTDTLRYQVFEASMYLSRKQADELTTSSLISRLTADTYHVHRMLGMIQRIGVRAPILLIGGLVMCFQIDVTLSLILLAIQPVIAATVILIARKGVPLFQTLQQRTDSMVTVIRENILGTRMIKALGKRTNEQEKFEAVNQSVVTQDRRARTTMSVSNYLTTWILHIGRATVILIGAYRVNAGLTTPGVVIAFLSYFVMILNGMYSVSRIFIAMSKGLASFGRVAEVIDQTPDLQVMNIPQEQTPYHMICRQVDFSYYGQKNDLSNVSFALKRGDFMGVIGATGSGKTSLIKCLLRFYDVDRGQILIDGRDIRSIPPAQLYKKIGVAFQDDVLFSDTIAANIAFGRDLSMEQLAQAAMFAQAEEFIESLDGSMDYRLAVRGSNLSGGQRQRIILSRAMADMPEILIFDDASSALDYLTDDRIRRALAQQFCDVTRLVITQRVRSIRDADLILVMDDGNVVGQGTHDELMSSCEVYKKIASIQLGEAEYVK